MADRAPCSQTSNSAQSCEFGIQLGSDANLVHGGSVGAEQSGLKEIELSTAVHLAFDELELGDLALRLAVGSWQSDGSADSGPVLGDAVGE